MSSLGSFGTASSKCYNPATVPQEDEHKNTNMTNMTNMTTRNTASLNVEDLCPDPTTKI